MSLDTATFPLKRRTKTNQDSLCLVVTVGLAIRLNTQI